MTRNHALGGIRLVAAGTHYVSLELSGSKIAPDDSALVALGEALQSETVLNLLLELKGFTGWDPYPAAHSIWRYAHAPANLSKVAFLCNAGMAQQLIVELGRPLFSDRVRVFGVGDRMRALAWVSTPSLSSDLGMSAFKAKRATVWCLLSDTLLYRKRCAFMTSPSHLNSNFERFLSRLCAVSLVAFSLTWSKASLAEGKLSIDAGANFPREATGVERGWGAGLRLGHEWDLVLVALTPEIGVESLSWLAVGAHVSFSL